MPKRIPISALRDLAKSQGLRQAILFAWDGELTHIVTYGESVEDCDQAAQGGEQIRRMFPWMEGPEALPSRVKAMQRRVAELEAENQFLRSLPRVGDPVIRTEDLDTHIWEERTSGSSELISKRKFTPIRGIDN